MLHFYEIYGIINIEINESFPFVVGFDYTIKEVKVIDCSIFN